MNSNRPVAEPRTIPPIKNHGSVPNHLSSSQPRPQQVTTDAKSAIPAAYAKPLFRFSSWSELLATRSPAFARQVVFGNVVKERATRVTHGVVNETDVRAPAGFAAVDGAELRLPFVCSPESTEVVIEIGK